MRNLDMVQRLAEMKITRNEMVKRRQTVMNDDQWSVFEDLTKGLTKEDIIAMEPSKILEMNKIDDETLFIVIPDFEKDEEVIGYLKDMFIFLKDVEKFTAELDNSTEKLNKIMQDSNEELRKALQESGDNNVVTMMRNTLKKELENAKEGPKKELLQKSYNAFEDSFDLNRLKELYKEIGGANLKKDATVGALDVYHRYVKANKELGLSYDLAMIGDLEVNYLPEEYHDMKNIFIFICMRYISRLTKNRGAKKATDGLFASQLATNIYMLTQNSLPEEDRERFVNSIKELLDIVR